MRAIRSQRNAGILCITAGVIWFLVYFGARGALEAFELSPLVRAAIALLPVPPFLLFILAEVRILRSLDELQRRIQLEALAIAFPAALLLLMALGLLELAIPLPPEDLSYRHVWAFLILFYFGGLAIARKRYQ